MGCNEGQDFYYVPKEGGVLAYIACTRACKCASSKAWTLNP